MTRLPGTGWLALTPYRSCVASPKKVPDLQGVYPNCHRVPLSTLRWNGRPIHPPPKSMKALSILVVDDHEIMRDVVCQILEDCGHEVALASDGGDALDLLGATHFDVLVTDIVMRQMDGIELIREVRRQFPSMRILAMSGGGERFPIVDGLELAMQAGAGAMLKKPFRAEELRETMALLCRESTLAVS